MWPCGNARMGSRFLQPCGPLRKPESKWKRWLLPVWLRLRFMTCVRLWTRVLRSARSFCSGNRAAKAATQRIKRLIDKIALEKLAKASSSDGIVRGSLAQMNVIDLVQSLEMGRKSCLLTLSKDNDKCEMYFTDGQVPHAVYGSLNGD